MEILKFELRLINNLILRFIISYFMLLTMFDHYLCIIIIKKQFNSYANPINIYKCLFMKHV